MAILIVIESPDSDFENNKKVLTKQEIGLGGLWIAEEHINNTYL